jgi:ABC-type bacteriocin/lantibiotic exporter with double-glycine peptidase domain
MIYIIAILVITVLAYLFMNKKTSDTDIPDDDLGIVNSKILDIDYQKSGGTNWCLVACLSMLLDYYGVNKSQSVIAPKIMMDNGSGSNIQKAIRYVDGLGFGMKFAVMKLPDILNHVYLEYPVIAVMGYTLNNRACHARILKGYDIEKEKLIFADSSIKNNYEMSFSNFRELSLVGSNKDYCHVLIMKPKGE